MNKKKVKAVLPAMMRMEKLDVAALCKAHDAAEWVAVVRRLMRIGLLAQALAMALLPALAHSQTPEQRKEIAVLYDCASPRNQALLNAPMRADPRDNVWVLEVLDAMGLNRHCGDLDEHLLANYLERQAANDVVQEPIGQPSTVREAIAWEKQAEFDGTRREVAHDLTRLHSRLLTRGFALEPWSPAAADVEMLRKAPKFVMTTPGLWVTRGAGFQASMPLAVTLSFVNRASRTIEWDAHTLYARTAADGRYGLLLSCLRDGLEGPRFTINRATVAPGARVNVLCLLGNSDVPLGTLDAAWLDRLQHGEQQWFVEGPPSDGGTYDYKRTIAAFTSEQSRAAANAYTSQLTCVQSEGCLRAYVAWVQSPLYQWLILGLPAFVVGIILLVALGRGDRVRMAWLTPYVVITIILLYAAIVAFFVLGDYGMGALAVAVDAGRVAIGAIFGVLAASWAWAKRAARAQRP